VRANISLLFLFDPLLGTEFPPPGDGPQNHLFTDRDREIIDELAGELLTLVAALDLFITAARFYGAFPAVCPNSLGEAAVAYQVFRFSAVNGRKLLLEFFVAIAGGYIDTAYAAI
jgi:hypothetical protein